MSIKADEAVRALTEREKQTLRLIVRGHDAKSTARSLGLSVHTINERLRDARRKMAVSSSREAARLLFEAESGDAGLAAPELFGDTKIGDDAARIRLDSETAPIDGVRRTSRRLWIITGVFGMMFALGLLALAALPQIASAPAPAVSDAGPNTEVIESARQWLALVDQGRWEESYRATGEAFRKLNTAQVWAATSQKVRPPLGAAISRTFVSQENLPAPPGGYEVVKFRTRFANRADALETVTLDREDGGWRVVGVTIR
jgi:DNA-binding CsgD family transcriptional regulator